MIIGNEGVMSTWDGQRWDGKTSTTVPEPKFIEKYKDMTDYYKYQTYLPHHKDADDLGYVHSKELWEEKHGR